MNSYTRRTRRILDRRGIFSIASSHCALNYRVHGSLGTPDEAECGRSRARRPRGGKSIYPHRVVHGYSSNVPAAASISRMIITSTLMSALSCDGVGRERSYATLGSCQGDEG